MYLEEDNNIHLVKDEQNRIRHIDHMHQPYRIKRKIRVVNAKNIAATYISEVIGIKKGINVTKTSRISNLTSQLVYSSEKGIMNTSVVEFQQFHYGIPVWLSGISVSMNSKSFTINCATNNYDYDLKSLKVDHKKIAAKAKNIDKEKIFDLMAMGKNLIAVKKGLEREVKLSDLKLTINSINPLIYRYNAIKRQGHRPHKKDKDNQTILGNIPQLVLPDVDKKITEDKHYVVFEVLFTITSPWASLNWRALIEPETNSLLYLRALVAHLENGLVYDKDPLTLTGDTSITAGSPTGSLNSVRTPRPLPGLTLAIPQTLTGQYIRLEDLLEPAIAPPTITSGEFDFDANSDDFAATNAYYHSDAVFRMVEEMGFDMSVYFDGTTFPVSVDHRGKSGQVNAKAPGNTSGDGSDGFRYGLIESGQSVGIASSVRIVLHEFGHAILWDNVHSPNFGFAHSAGDSMAAIFCDPSSKAPDRFETFPWLKLCNPTLDRRHDRDIAAGWAFKGVNDDGGYGAEQILSTSHFRIYRSIGGDHSRLCEREFASRYVLYLIIHATGILTPTTNPNSAEDWAAKLMTSDLNTINFEGHLGGAVHKVIRWAFEKQGAYQPANAPEPIITEGLPPSVDLYINDGREGEYEFTEDAYNCRDIWNRRNPDGGAAHQKPEPGVTNYAYVIVKNRGTKTVKHLIVKGFQHRKCCCDTCNCNSVDNLMWPNDFQPMKTENITITSPIPPGQYMVVGPFEWKPNHSDFMMMTVDAKEDLSNITIIPSGESIPVKHLVPFDNNMAIRNLCC